MWLRRHFRLLFPVRPYVGALAAASSDVARHTHRRAEKICLISEQSVGMSGHSWITIIYLGIWNNCCWLRLGRR
jgi:hypothetical protein